MDRFRRVFGRFGESAELGEAHDRVSAAKDRWQRGHTEIFVHPVGGQREIVGGELEHVPVLAPIMVHLLEMARGDDTKPQIPEALGDLQGAGAGRERLVQLVERRMDRRHQSVDLATPTIVLQPLGEGLGLAEVLEHRSAFTELAQHPPQLEANVEGLLERGLALRQCRENSQSLLETSPGVRQRRSRGRLSSGLPEIVHCLLPHLAPHSVMGKPLDLLTQAGRRKALLWHRRHARGCRGGVRAAPRCR